MDEVHFQQYGSRCRMWVPPEVKDPVLQHHPTRKSVGYFGAVRLRDGNLSGSDHTLNRRRFVDFSLHQSITPDMQAFENPLTQQIC